MSGRTSADGRFYRTHKVLRPGPAGRFCAGEVLMITTRREHECDAEAVRNVHEEAFENSAEADIVELLRERAEPYIALVEESESGLVRGHIVFTPITHDERPDLRILGLGPMAVLPAHQRTSIGSALVTEGLKHCRAKGFGAVVVLGHPEYYPRFGFVPASCFGISSEYDVPDEVFMALELQAGYLADASGIVKYHPSFGEA